MEFNGTTAAILFGVWATFALDIYGSFNSSPQTTEINAKARADSLMKYVYIADAVALAGGASASVVSKSLWPVVGAGVVVVLMHFLYVHAKAKGLASSEPGTEQYGY
jgi:hypothetical protein